MPKFKVYASQRIFYEMTIEAEDIEDARDLARSKAKLSEHEFTETDNSALRIVDVEELMRCPSK